MSHLFWEAHRRDTDEVGMVKVAIEDTPRDIGFPGASHSDADLFGIRMGCCLDCALSYRRSQLI